MVEEKFVCKRRKLSATIVALIILVSAIPVGFFMAILPVHAETGESESSGDGSYYVYGYVYGPDGALVNSSLIIVTNMRTGDGNATWTDETGYYSFNLAEMNNTYQIGDEIKVTGLDGMNIGNITINIGYENPGIQAYDITGNSWSSASPTPAGVGAGGALAYDGTSIYVLQGGGNQGFWRDDPPSVSVSASLCSPTGIDSSIPSTENLIAQEIKKNT